MEKPMRAYRVVQTGANSLSGGVHDGKSIFLYQPFSGRVAFTTIGVPDAPPMTCATIHGTDGGNTANVKDL